MWELAEVSNRKGEKEDHFIKKYQNRLKKSGS